MDDFVKEGFVIVVVVGLLGIENIVKCDKFVIVFRYDIGVDMVKFLYVSVNIEEKIKVNVESMDVGVGFVRYLEDIKVVVIVEFNEFVFVDGMDMELMFDGWNKRGLLEKSISEGFEGLSEGSFVIRDFVVEMDYVNVFFISVLLGFDEMSSVINVDNCFFIMLVILFLLI